MKPSRSICFVMTYQSRAGATMGTAFGCLAASSLQPLGVALSAPQVQGSTAPHRAFAFLRCIQRAEQPEPLGKRCTFRHCWGSGMRRDAGNLQRCIPQVLLASPD